MPPIGKLNPSSTVLLVCDVQERFREIIHKFESVAKTSKLMVEGFNALGLPIVTTEQYPKALGTTIAELPLKGPNNKTFQKMDFSMLTPEVRQHLSVTASAAKIDYLIVGLETHVCVLQTALDILESGSNVHVVVDAVSSSRPLDRQTALQRIEAAGGILTTAESALFMLMKSANHPNFKTISGLVKEYGKNPSNL